MVTIQSTPSIPPKMFPTHSIAAHGLWSRRKLVQWLASTLPIACGSRLGLATGYQESGDPERPLLLVHYMP